MYNDQAATDLGRNKLVLVFGGLAVIALLIIFFVFINKSPLGPGLDFDLHQLPGNTDVSAVTMYDDSMVFSNGRFLVAYNTKTGESRKLSNTSLLPTVSDIRLSPDHQHLLFKTNGDVIQNEQLAAKLADHEEIASDNGLWWLLDTNTGSFELLNGAVNVANWLDNSHVVYAYGPVITKQSIAGDKPQTLYRASQAVLSLAVTDSKITFNTFDNKIFVYDLSTGQATAVAKDPGTYRDVTLGKKAGCLFGQKGKDNPEDTVSVGLLVGCIGDKSNKKVGLGENPGYGTFSEDGRRFYYNDLQGSYRVNQYIDLITGRVGSWDAKSYPGDPADIKIIYAKDADTVLAKVNSRVYGSGVKSSKLIESDQSIKAPGLSVDLSADNQEVIASKHGAFSDSDKLAVDALLSQKGFDPSLLGISYIVLTSDTYRWD